jgi:hypothetical protein
LGARKANDLYFTHRGMMIGSGGGEKIRSANSPRLLMPRLFGIRKKIGKLGAS